MAAKIPTIVAPVAGAPADTLRVERLPLPSALALGTEAWDRASGNGGGPFSSWAWHRAWADTAPPGELHSGQALLVGRGDALVGIVPLTTRSCVFRRQAVQALTWATGDLGCPDGLGMPAEAEAAAPQLAMALSEMEWDVILLDNLHPASPVVASLATAFERNGYTVRTEERCLCPYLDLPSSWETYLHGLSASRRESVRHKERKLTRAHAISVREYGPQCLDEGWHHLVRLHQQRWEGAGAFQSDLTHRFHRTLMSYLAAQGDLWLTTLDLDGVPRAAWYGFTHGDTVYYYQSGRDPTWNRWSVGTVLMAMMIRRAIERGYRRFEFLRGNEPYKQQWTSTSRTTRQLVVFRRSWRGRLLAVFDWTVRLRSDREAHRLAAVGPAPDPADDRRHRGL